jgi:hypothetical protein
LDIIKILLAASELSLQELIFSLQSFLVEKELNKMEQNFNLSSGILDLQNFCTEFISNQRENFFNSPDFTSIPANVLISLIQLEDLQLNEIQIWELVLKWGIAQNPELSSDPSSYSNDDFNALKNTLQQLIPLIKFTEFTSKEFLNNVYPYKKIIPEDLRENLIKYFLDHDYIPTIDSKIITIQHTELISRWINNRLEITMN